MKSRRGRRKPGERTGACRFWAIAAAAAIFAAVSASAAFAGAPAGYYDAATGLTGTALRSALTTIISNGHSALGYDSARDEMFETLEDQGGNQVECAYTGTVATIGCRTGCGSTAGGASFDTEHTWPQAQFGSANPMVSDLHHLFPTLSCANNHRGSLPFNEPTSAIDEGCVSGDGSFRGTLGGNTVYEVRLDHRGDTARAMLYMIVRYWNQDSSFDPGLGPQDVSQAQLDLYFLWHAEDPPDNFERTRNDGVHSAQGNRNPFVDHPEYAALIWGAATPTPTPTPTPSPTPTGTPTPTPTPTPGGGLPWVNEIHYDNNGADADEGVEIAGPAGTNLSLWVLHGYNGSNNGVYTPTIPLSGVIPNQSNGYGTLWFPWLGLQNGAPDGLALVDPDGEVVQFLSYEGSFTASGGPADGMTSVDIGVAEGGTDPLGNSLQLGGTSCGEQYSDFTWQGIQAHTRGLINTGQTFCAAPTPTPTPTPSPTPTATPTPTPTATPTPTPSPTPAPASARMWQLYE